MHKLISLLATLAIIYYIFLQIVNNTDMLSFQTKSDAKPEAKQEGEPVVIEGNLLERTMSKVMINALKTPEGKAFIENLITPADKPIASDEYGFKLNNNSYLEKLYKISTEGKGKIGPVSCGHLVTFDYKISNLTGQQIFEGTKNYPLGNDELFEGLDAIIVGMKTNQIRTASVPINFAKSKLKLPSEIKNNLAGTFEVTIMLKTAMPDNFANDNVKIFDDEIAFQKPFICGKTMFFHSKITNLTSGKVVYDSSKVGKKIMMKIGQMNYPIIFSHSLHNKVPIGTRTVISPGRLIKSYLTDSSVIFPHAKFNQDDFYMVEFSETSAQQSPQKQQ